MKYKNIPSMLHNFASSYMSIMNIVEGETIRIVLRDFVKKLNGDVY